MRRHLSGTSTTSRITTLLLLATLLLTGACSNGARYELIRQNRLQECETLPIPQQAQCKAQYQTDYETYRREREAIR